MVALMPQSWLPDLKALLRSPAPAPAPAPPHSLGILAFEVAATMARLVSLHHSLSPSRVLLLRSDMRSQGIAYLVSADQACLLRLACAELLCELDRAADAVSRLSLRCRSPFPQAFSRAYPDAKNGSLMPLLQQFKFTKASDKRIAAMQKHVALAARLYSEMDALNDLEASERRMDDWMKHSGPIVSSEPKAAEQSDRLRRQLASQRHRVRRLIDGSLWQMTFDKAVGIMAKSALSILYRICLVFGQFVHGLPPVYNTTPDDALYSYTPRSKGKLSSAPLESPKAHAYYEMPIRHSAPIFVRKEEKSKPLKELINSMVPPPSTVGGAGMALRYANVILAADKLLAMRSGDPRPLDQGGDGEDDEWGTREELYEMLPAGVRAAMKAKLKECWKRDARAVADREVAEGWGQAVKGLLSWLGPMARDTERWHEERNLDRSQRFAMEPRMLKLKTLHFADLVKTEATMVEVLVGLSCMCWYHERRGFS